jgi:hypothetical protein
MWGGFIGSNIFDMNRIIKKRFLIAAGLLLNAINALSQVVITTPGITGNMIKPDMLWNVIILSQDPLPFAGRVCIVVNDINNQPVLKAQSGVITFSRGPRQLNYNNVLPVEYLYNSLGQPNEWISAGKYTVCYSVNREQESKSFTTIAEECVDLTIDAVSPPLLNSPVDNSTIYEIYPSFTWVPPSPKQLFKHVYYEFKLVEIKEDQTALYAIQTNTPVFFRNGINANVTMMPSSYAALKTGQEYAWQVTAYNNSYSIKSEAWKFIVGKDSVMEIIESSPYVQLKQDKPDIGIMHQGYIKIAFTNYTKDTTAQFYITPEDAPSKANTLTVDIKIKPGENYILKKIDSRFKFDENKTYRVTWINSWKENWIVRFKPKYYR